HVTGVQTCALPISMPMEMAYPSVLLCSAKLPQVLLVQWWLPPKDSQLQPFPIPVWLGIHGEVMKIPMIAGNWDCHICGAMVNSAPRYIIRCWERRFQR